VGGLPRRGAPLPLDEEGDDNYDVVKEEANEAMEDTAPSGTGELSPEYKAVLATSYDEEALQQQVLEASKADDDRAFPGLEEALELTGMVAGHLASLSRPPPLPVHAPPRAAYAGQEDPPPSGSLPRRRRHDHPHGVVINPPQPQSEVMVDLVSDDEV
jgi:hypothetical protein